MLIDRDRDSVRCQDDIETFQRIRNQMMVVAFCALGVSPIIKFYNVVLRIHRTDRSFNQIYLVFCVCFCFLIHFEEDSTTGKLNVILAEQSAHE